MKIISMRLILAGHCPLSPVASCEHYFEAFRVVVKFRVVRGWWGG